MLPLFRLQSGDRRQLHCASSEGCVLFHINDKETSGGARSHYHGPICLKRASFTIQSAGVPRNPVKAGGCLNDKTGTTSLFVSETRAAQFHQNQGYLHALQWGYSCIKKEALLHRQVSLVVEPFFLPETIALSPPPKK